MLTHTASRSEAVGETVLDKFEIARKHLPAESFYTPITHWRGHTFYVVVDTSHRPRVTHIKPDNSVVRVYLDREVNSGNQTNNVYLAFPDPHNRFSLGIDPNGYVHITGDMHNFGAKQYDERLPKFQYPERYDDKKGAVMLYWRSAKPWDLSGGFEFLGYSGSPYTMPGTFWTYGRFFNDRNGTLYYSSRVRAYNSINWSLPNAKRGVQGLGLYLYDETARRWEALGGPPELALGNVQNRFDVFYWAYSGRPDTEYSYQVYQADFNFDVNGRLHFAGSGHVGQTGAVRLVYAYSDDGGRTWYTVRGSRIPGFPLCGDDGSANMPDVLQESQTSFVCAVVADRNGTPVVKHGTSYPDGWFMWTGSNWIRKTEAQYDRSEVLNGYQAHSAPNGDMIFSSTWGVYWYRDLATYHTSNSSVANPVFAQSDLGIVTGGDLYGLRANNAGTSNTNHTELRVVRQKFGEEMAGEAYQQWLAQQSQPDADPAKRWARFLFQPDGDDENPRAGLRAVVENGAIGWQFDVRSDLPSGMWWVEGASDLGQGLWQRTEAGVRLREDRPPNSGMSRFTLLPTTGANSLRFFRLVTPTPSFVQ